MRNSPLRTLRLCEEYPKKMYPHHPPKISPPKPATNGQFPLAALPFFVRERRGLGGCPYHKTKRYSSQKSKLSHVSRFKTKKILCACAFASNSPQKNGVHGVQNQITKITMKIINHSLSNNLLPHNENPNTQPHPISHKFRKAQVVRRTFSLKLNLLNTVTLHL